MITLYDIPSNVPGRCWSPNVWKVRYALNYKGIPHETEWIEFPDIAGHLKSLDIGPLRLKPDGSPHYTLPAIHDTKTGFKSANSHDIAEYLERAYSDSPSLFPRGTIALQLAYEESYTANLNELWDFILPAVNFKLSPRSEEYFRRTREPAFGKKIEEIVPVGEERVIMWKKYQAGLEVVNTWYGKTDSEGPYLLGKDPTWADFVTAGYLIWLERVWGPKSEEWTDIVTWNEGRWGNLIRDFDVYAEIH